MVISLRYRQTPNHFVEYELSSYYESKQFLSEEFQRCMHTGEIYTLMLENDGLLSIKCGELVSFFVK